MDKIKILYIYDKMPGVYQQYLLGLLAVAKHKFHLKTLVYKPSNMSDYNIKTYGVKDNLYRLCYKLKLIRSKSIDIKIMSQFDIIHLQHSFLWKKILPILEKEKRPKIVITLRGGDTYLKPWTYITLANFYKTKSALIDAFIVMSNHQKKYLQQWGVSEDKISVIPISFGEPTHAKPKYPNKDKLRLVSAYRMTWEKNIEGHIQFAIELKNKQIPFSYDIYGDGKDIDQLYYLIDIYGLEDYVSVKGKVNNKELKKLLPNYDFYLQLSITESLGMGAIEAQSYGLPCVVTNCGGLPETVVKNKTAIVGKYTSIINLVNQCVDLWRNHDEYYNYSASAIESVHSKFTTKHELEKLEKLYKHILHL